MKLAPAEEDQFILEIATRYLRERSASSSGDDLWKAFAKMGWLAMPLDEASGGIGATASTLAALLEALGRECVQVPYAASVIHGLGLLASLPDRGPRDLIGCVAEGSARLAVVEGPLSAEGQGGGFLLSGRASLVPGGQSATMLLVAAHTGKGLALFRLGADTPGVTITGVDTIDGSDMADISLHTAVAGQPLDASADLGERLAWAKDRTAALLCADAVGAMTALLEKTGEYSRTRQQFGKPLRSFQVVDHFIADMQILVEEARSAALLACGTIGSGRALRRRGLSAARVKIGAAARRVGHLAVQLHGAMGVTDELDIGAYLKRLIAFDLTYGTRRDYLDLYATIARSGETSSYLASAEETAGSPDFGLSRSAAETRAGMVRFLDAELPSDIARGQRLSPSVYAEPDIAGPWHAILARNGFAAPNWPRAFGGTGWAPEERYVWAHESGRRNVPVTSPLGLPLVGPVLIHFGTPVQQARYLPRIVDGSELWCQGFSEPGAGSDLAALATRAVRDGDHYIVNGSKIWTTHGHFAQQMAALVRTGAPGGRRDGISFLIIDMSTVGITVRPITTIGGDHEVNQIFFDDVRVPIENLVGQEGQGWSIAKFLLEHERGGDIMSAGHRALLNEVRAAAFERDVKAESFWQSFATVSIDIDILEVTELRSLLGVTQSDALPSILKLRASEIQQSVTNLGAEVLGADLLRRYPQRPLYADPGTPPAHGFAARYLNSYATTIFGGAREIQKGIIARAAP